MDLLTQSNPGHPLRWLVAGILIGTTLAYLDFHGIILLILVGLAVLAYCHGYRVMIQKNDGQDDSL